MKTILTLSLLFSLFSGFAQEYAYLNDIKLKKDQDFIDHEETMIKALNFLMKSPYKRYSSDAEACSDFIWTYAKKTPHFTVALQGPIMLLKKNDVLFRIYVGLWARSEIKNPERSDAEHDLFCYRNLGKYCSMNKNRLSRKGWIKLSNAYENGTVEEWRNEF